MKRSTSPEMVARNREIIELAKSGVRSKGIAEEMGVSKNVVAGVLFRAGIPAARMDDEIPSPRFPPSGRCQWPLWGHTEAPTFKFCGKPTGDITSWCCPMHRAIGYYKVVRRGAQPADERV